uniref:(northern house mosquito) hypothetical protein n=1 Tax=Culex pipiens TaxID=7175 RepID=A0A8D8CBT9_CULPI
MARKRYFISYLQEFLVHFYPFFVVVMNISLTIFGVRFCSRQRYEVSNGLEVLFQTVSFFKMWMCFRSKKNWCSQGVDDLTRSRERKLTSVSWHSSPSSTLGIVTLP